MPARARPRGESWTGPFLPGRLLVFVVLAGPVRRRILVGLADPLYPVDFLRVECPLDHLVPLARGERILPRVAVLRRPDPHDDFVVRLEDPSHGREVPAVERLESADEQSAAAHSSSSDMKWSMYGHSSVRNLRQWTHRPSSWAG